MKKLLLLLTFILCISFVNAQEVALVFDPIALDEMITQTYALERNIENQIKEIGYMYEFMQTQIKSIEKLDPKSYFAIRNFVIARDSALKSLKARMRNLGVKIGDENYSLGDVLPTDKEINAWFKSLEEAKETKNTQQYLTTLEVINNKDKTIRQYLTETSLEAAAVGIEADDFIHNQLDFEELLDEIEGNESITSQLQISNKLSLELNSAISRLVQSVAVMNKMYAANTLSDVFKDYKLSIPQNLNPGSAGIDTTPSDEYEEYMNNQNNNSFDPLELFNRK